MLCNKIYDNYINKKNSQYSPRDEEVSLDKLEKVGRAPALALQKTREGCKIEGEGFLATNIMLSSLSLTNTAIPSLALLSNCCSSSDAVSHSLHIVANS